MKHGFIKSNKRWPVALHSVIGKLPQGGLTVPSHKYTGPYNPLVQQLDSNDKPLPRPFNQIDAIALKHDISY